jgi:hypothetical protein
MQHPIFFIIGNFRFVRWLVDFVAVDVKYWGIATIEYVFGNGLDWLFPWDIFRFEV